MTKQDNNNYDMAKKEIMKAWSQLRQVCISLGTLSPDSKNYLKNQGEKIEGRKNGQ